MRNQDLTGEALNKRIAEIRRVLKLWIPSGGVESLRLLELFTEFRILPFSGGWLEQPAWIRDDFEMLMLWFELVRLTEKLTPSTANLPKMQDVVAGNLR